MTLLRRFPGPLLSLLVVVVACSLAHSPAVTTVLAAPLPASADPAGPAIVFTSQPVHGIPFFAVQPRPRVEVHKADGTIDYSFTGTITVSLAPGTGGCCPHLSGQLAMSAIDGQAWFTVIVDAESAGLVLLATADGYQSATTQPFNVDYQVPVTATGAITTDATYQPTQRFAVGDPIRYIGEITNAGASTTVGCSWAVYNPAGTRLDGAEGTCGPVAPGVSDWTFSGTPRQLTADVCVARTRGTPPTAARTANATATAPGTDPAAGAVPERAEQVRTAVPARPAAPVTSARVAASCDLTAVFYVTDDHVQTKATSTFTVQAVQQPPPPVLTSLSPGLVPAGGPDRLMTLAGSAFLPAASVVEFDGEPLPPASSSATKLQAWIPARLTATPGIHTITVVNVGYDPPSQSVRFTVGNPVPAIAGLDTTSVAVGTGATTVTISGNNFLPTAQVAWDGAVKPAAEVMVVSPTEVRAVLTASQLRTVGKHRLTVINPWPAGGASNVAPFTVRPLPSISVLSPASALVGTPTDLVLTLTGSNFAADATVTWTDGTGTQALPTTFVSPTKLTAVVPASLLTVLPASQPLVAVKNPATGDSAGARPFTILSLPTPVLAYLNVTQVAAGHAAFTLTLTGTGFVPGRSIVRWTVNGASSEHPATVVSGTRIDVPVTAADVATPGTVSIMVETPGPGGGTTLARTFTVK